MTQANQKSMRREGWLDIPASKVGIGIILVLVYFLFFAPIEYLPDRSIVKYMGILIVGLYVAYHAKILLQRKYLSMNIVVALFIIFSFISSFINRSSISTRDPVLAAIVYFGVLFEVLLVLEIAAERKLFGFTVNLYLVLTTITVLITDFLLFVLPSLYNRFGYLYLVGTKFQVSYIHVQLLVWVLLCKKNRGIKSFSFYGCLIAVGILSIFVSIYVDCMTGAIFSILFLFFYCLFQKPVKVLANPLVIEIVLIFFTVIFFVWSSLLENEYIVSCIVNVLGRDPTMTSRMIIYKRVLEVMQGHWLLGYGYGSAYEISQSLIGAPNLQNGLLHWLMMCGLVPTFLILVMLFVSFKRLNARKAQFALYPVIVVLYCYSIIASVEVCISGHYFFWIFFIYVFSTCFKDSPMNNRYVKTG